MYKHALEYAICLSCTIRTPSKNLSDIPEAAVRDDVAVEGDFGDVVTMDCYYV